MNSLTWNCRGLRMRRQKLVPQIGLLDGDKSWNEKDEENHDKGRFTKWNNFP